MQTSLRLSLSPMSGFDLEWLAGYLHIWTVSAQTSMRHAFVRSLRRLRSPVRDTKSDYQSKTSRATSKQRFSHAVWWACRHIRRCISTYSRH